MYSTCFSFFSDYMKVATTPSTPLGLACQRTDGEGCKVDMLQCSAMNQCWPSIGECVEGKCACRSAGWKGGDCSL